MADTRKGLNCTLTYPRKGVNHTLRCRVDMVGHGLVMVADESSGRNRRAYYPHRVAPAQFYIRALLNGWSERKAFSDWIQTYADFVMDPGLPAGSKFPDMRVLIPARKFDREGVPLTGFDWGDTIGGMLWTPTITFETTREPQDANAVATSKFVAATDKDASLKYFWPSGTQLGGNAVPSGAYTTVINGSDGGSDPGQSPVPLPHSSGADPGFARDDYGN